MAMTSSASFFIASPKQRVYAWTSGSTSLLGDPVGYVRRAVEDTDSSALTGPEEANSLHVDESHFFQIQRDLRSNLLDLPLDFAHMLGLHSTDQSNRRAAPVRIPLDPQGQSGLVRSGYLGKLVPNIGALLLDSSLEGVDIRACPVPSDDLARVVAYRLEPSQDPAKRPIMATKTSFELTALTRRHDLGPLLAQLRKVFGVNRRLPSLPPGLVCRDTRIVLPTLVHEFVRAVGKLAPGDRRDSVENRSTLRGVGVCGPRIRSVHARRTLSLFRLYSQAGTIRSRSNGSSSRPRSSNRSSASTKSTIESGP